MKTLIILALVCTALALRPRKAKVAKGMLCDFCMSFIGGLEHFLETEEGPIDEYADKLCDQLTGGNPLLDPICRGLVDTELPKIVEWLEKDEPPEKVCGFLHLC